MEFKKDEYVKMVRNPTYWGTQPTLDQIVFEYYTNTDTMVQDLKSGTIDGAQVIPPEQFKRLEGEPGIETDRLPALQLGVHRRQLLRQPGLAGQSRAEGREVPRGDGVGDRPREVRRPRAGAATLRAATASSPRTAGRRAPTRTTSRTPRDTIGFDVEKAGALMDEAGYKDTDGDGIREDKSGKPIKLRLWARDISPESQVQGKLIAGWLKDIGLDIDYTVVDEGALGDSIWNYKGSTYAPDYDLALWDFMGYIDPGDSAACFTTDQIENYNEMNWSNPEYDRLTVEQYREMDTARRMDTAQAGAGRDVRRAADDRHRLPVRVAGREHLPLGRLAAVRRRQRVGEHDRPPELHRAEAQGGGRGGDRRRGRHLEHHVVRHRRRRGCWAAPSIVVLLKRAADGRAVEE